MARGKPDTPPFQLNFTSAVSSKTGEPFIHMKWGEMEGQLTPNEAKQHAYHVLEAVEAAYTDAFLVNFLVEKLGSDRNTAALILRDFRAYRAALNERGI